MTMFRKMRIIKQQITREECIRILKEEPRGILSMLGDDGYPYGMNWGKVSEHTSIGRPGNQIV